MAFEDNIKYPLRKLIGKENYLHLRLLLTKDKTQSIMVY